MPTDARHTENVPAIGRWLKMDESPSPHWHAGGWPARSCGLQPGPRHVARPFVDRAQTLTLAGARSHGATFSQPRTRNDRPPARGAGL